MEGCTCQQCQDKKSAILAGITLAENEILSEYKKGLMALGLPKEKMLAAIERAKRGIK